MIVRRIGIFGVVGALATLTYAVLALGFEQLGTEPVTASFMAYLVGMTVSYSGHKWLTFASNRRHGDAIPRFIAVNLLGLGLSLALPWLLTRQLGLPSTLAVVAACILVPLASFVGHSRLVFPDSAKR